LRHWSLAALELLDLQYCGLTALPEGIGGLTGLKSLFLGSNMRLTALPEGLWSLAALELLNLMFCGLAALPEAGTSRFWGLVYQPHRSKTRL
jgi:hypothetical protein